MTTEPKLLSASGNTHLTRPRYSAGLMLQAEDLTQAVDYTRELNRLMFRSLLGCGVVCGLQVTLHKKNGCLAIHIAPGLALTGCGDPIHVPTEQIIPLNSDCGHQDDAKTLWVVIHRTNRYCMPRDLACSSDENASAPIHTRSRDGFEILLEKGKEARAGACGSPQAKAAPPAETAKPDWYLKYAGGVCDCDCDSEWVVLAVVEEIDNAQEGWRYGDHSVRRFLRPQLMADPVPVPPRPFKTTPYPEGGQNLVDARAAWRAANRELSAAQADAAQRLAEQAALPEAQRPEKQAAVDAAEQRVADSAAQVAERLQAMLALELEIPVARTTD